MAGIDALKFPPASRSLKMFVIKKGLGPKNPVAGPPSLSTQLQVGTPKGSPDLPRDPSVRLAELKLVPDNRFCCGAGSEAVILLPDVGLPPGKAKPQPSGDGPRGAEGNFGILRFFPVSSKAVGMC